jgi:hypothetical protein
MSGSGRPIFAGCLAGNRRFSWRELAPNCSRSHLGQTFNISDGEGIHPLERVVG